MLNYQLEIVGDEFLTSSSIGHSDEFNVYLLFDRSIYRPMCSLMGNCIMLEPRQLIYNNMLNFFGRIASLN